VLLYTNNLYSYIECHYMYCLLIMKKKTINFILKHVTKLRYVYILKKII